MVDFKDELDASLEFGSGYICLIGPPSSGKTTQLLEYLTSREEAFAESLPCFRLEYVSARSLCGDTLGYFSRRLHPGPARRGLASECTPLDFGGLVGRWLAARPRGSELHLAVDDADLLRESVDAIDLWLSGCLPAADAQGSRVCLWLLAQIPPRLANCVRYLFLPPPSEGSWEAWLDEDFSRKPGFLLESEESENEAEKRPRAEDEAGADVAPGSHLAAKVAHRFVMQAMHYYTTHLPMRASVVCKDRRMLLKRVYQLLPALVAAVGGDASKLNAVHYAGVWGRFKEIANRHSGNISGESRQDLIGPSSVGAPDRIDPLVRALKRISYSAVLLAFAAFYCGAVPKSKQIQVFSKEVGIWHLNRKPSAEANAQSHKASTLSASAHVINVQQLLLIYKAMRDMCKQHLDSMELTSAEMAAHYIHGLVAWGLLTPTVSQRKKKFHCWISISTALQLGNTLSLNLFELIPT